MPENAPIWHEFARHLIGDFLAALVRCDTPGCIDGQVEHVHGGHAGVAPLNLRPCPSHRPHVVLAERDGGVVVLESEVVEVGPDSFMNTDVVIAARLDDESIPEVDDA